MFDPGLSLRQFPIPANVLAALRLHPLYLRRFLRPGVRGASSCHHRLIDDPSTVITVQSAGEKER